MPKNLNPAVSINRPFYTMASVDGDSADVEMYGDIVESQPKDWWTGEPIDGSYIIESEFLEDLNALKNCTNITIRMDSCGGDAGVSILIHNRLRELATNGAKLTCIVDGVAMSGGSLIMSACDTVKVNPSSLVMIHKCWTSVWGAYNADELRHLAESNDAYDKAQVAIYQRKTGLSDTVLLHMMANTTYMTGKEAVGKGFADELLTDAEPVSIAASADRQSLFVKGRQLHLCSGFKVPEHIPVATPAVYQASGEAIHNHSQGGKTMAKTIEELRSAYPDLVEQIEANASKAAADDAVKAERERMKEIDEVSVLFDPEMVRAAKYDNPCTARDLSYMAAQRSAKQGTAFLTGLMADTATSGTKNVGAVPAVPADPDESPDTPESIKAQARADVAAFQSAEREVR